MADSRKNLVREAVAKALMVRRSMKVTLTQAIDPYRVAASAGIRVRFKDLSSFEGVFYAQNPRIILSALRPSVRQNYTCAHELGHYYLNHGFKMDEFIDMRDKSSFQIPEELAADSFAGELLMPKSTILSGFSSRGFQLSNHNPLEYYIVSQWLGVGYSTLLNHLHYSLSLIDGHSHARLNRYKRKDIRAEIIGEPCKGEIYVLDGHWTGRSIDIKVGDILVSDSLMSPSVPDSFSEQPQLSTFYPHRLMAVKRGSYDFNHTGVPGPNLPVRVSPTEFIGLEEYKYLDDND